jgi:drug/metabolite transporter (DMT)-like permease
MKPRDLFDLVLLAALWGASFLFMRIAAPAFGPVALVELRVAIAALVLVALVLWRGQFAELRSNLLKAATIGALNSALPFVLFTYAVLTITAGLASILNALTPMFTAAIGAAVLRERLRPLQWLGLVAGVAGVTVLLWGKVDLRPGGSQWGASLAIAAAILAAFIYGVAAHAARRLQAGVAPLVTATGSQIGAAAVLLVPGALMWPAQSPDAGAWAAVIALAVACTAVAYILYFRLIARVGALRAASVTFLIPLFGTSWGAIFLDETITTQMLAGGAIVIAGTVLTLGLVGAPRAAGPAVASGAGR